MPVICIKCGKLGIGPVQHILIGGAGEKDFNYKAWIDELYGAGERGACEF